MPISWAWWYTRVWQYTPIVGNCVKATQDVSIFLLSTACKQLSQQVFQRKNDNNAKWDSPTNSHQTVRLMIFTQMGCQGTVMNKAIINTLAGMGRAQLAQHSWPCPSVTYKQSISDCGWTMQNQPHKWWFPKKIKLCPLSSWRGVSMPHKVTNNLHHWFWVRSE